jgi:hypothetical protein
MTTRDPQGKLHYAGIVRVASLLAVVASSGCVIVPHTTHTPTVVGVDDRDVVPPRRTQFGIELASHRGAVVTMRVLAPRVCTKELWHVIDTKHETTATFDVADPGNDPWAGVILIVLAPVTLTVSGIVTAIIVSGRDTTVTRDRKKISSSMFECPVFGADMPVALTLPSGAVAELRTNEHGETHLDIPPSEPDQGDVSVRVGDLPPRVVHYCRACEAPATAQPAAPLPAPDMREQTVDDPTAAADHAACLKQRSQRMFAAQQVSDIKERTRQLQSLPVCR